MKSRIITRTSAKLLTATVLMGSVAVMTTSPALACNTRDGAQSYMNSTQNVNQVPGAPSSFFIKSGGAVWMNGWSQGPKAFNQYKWFQITVRGNPGYGLTGWVPAPSVSNQWNCSPYIAW